MGSKSLILEHLLEPTGEIKKHRTPLPYLVANGVAWLAIVVLLLHDSSMLAAAILSTVVLTGGLSWLIFERFHRAEEACNIYRYQLKLSKQNIEKLKEEVTSARQLDPLTHCLNEKRFRKEVARFIALNERSGIDFSIIRLRIDQYADILGRDGQRHSNELLSVFSRILKASLREVDSVARFNEEHFAILLSGSNATGAIIVANRVTKLTEQLRTARDDERVTLSIGITEYHGTEDQFRIVQDAETALSKAVDQGGDCTAGYNHNPKLKAAG